MTTAPETFLSRILAHKQTEVERQWLKVPLERLQERIAQAPPVRSFSAALRQAGRVALIAEVKKASPSRGVLLESFDPLTIAQTYADNGAAAISVLTDVRFFQGSLKFLEGIRQLNLPPPLLRKDFLLDPYQVYEARAYGADAVLLIVAALEDTQLAALLALTHELGMQALVEVHNEPELQRALHVGASLIGVNNRDLHTFTTTLETTRQIATYLQTTPAVTLVSESGLFTAADVELVATWGAHAVLIGEALVTAPDIGASVRALAGRSLT